MATHALFLKRCSQRTPATVTLCIIGILGGVAGVAPPRACSARLSRPLPCIGRERCAPQCASSNRYLALVTGCARPRMHEPHSTPKAARSWIAKCRRRRRRAHDGSRSRSAPEISGAGGIGHSCFQVRTGALQDRVLFAYSTRRVRRARVPQRAAAKYALDDAHLRMT